MASPAIESGETDLSVLLQLLKTLIPQSTTTGGSTTTSGTADVAALRELFAQLQPGIVKSQTQEGINYQTDRLLQGPLGAFINAQNASGGYGGVNPYLSQMIVDTAGQGAALTNDAVGKAQATAAPVAANIAQATKATTVAETKQSVTSPKLPASSSILTALLGANALKSLFGKKGEDTSSAGGLAGIFNSIFGDSGSTAANTVFDRADMTIAGEGLGAAVAPTAGAGVASAAIAAGQSGVSMASDALQIGAIVDPSFALSSAAASDATIAGEGLAGADVAAGAAGLIDIPRAGFDFSGAGDATAADIAALAGDAAGGLDAARAGFDFSGAFDATEAGVDALAGGAGFPVVTAGNLLVQALGGDSLGTVAGEVGDTGAELLNSVGSFIEDTSGWVICTELRSGGELPAALYAGASHHFLTHPRRTITGYHFWAIPYTRLMRRSKLARKIMAPIAINRAAHIAGRWNIIGWLTVVVGEPLCAFIGRFVRRSPDWRSLYSSTASAKVER